MITYLSEPWNSSSLLLCPARHLFTPTSQRVTVNLILLLHKVLVFHHLLLGQQCGGVSPLLFVTEMSVTRALLLLCYLVAIRGSESSSPVGQEMRERIANGSVNILTTTIVPERVLIRRKRFLIFPKGSAIAVSCWSGPVTSITNCE